MALAEVHGLLGRGVSSVGTWQAKSTNPPLPHNCPLMRLETAISSTGVKVDKHNLHRGKVIYIEYFCTRLVLMTSHLHKSRAKEEKSLHLTGSFFFATRTTEQCLHCQLSTFVESTFALQRESEKAKEQ